MIVELGGRPGIAEDPRVVEARGALGVAIEKLRLGLQLVGRRPVVVAFQEGHVFAAARVDRLGQIPIDPHVPITEPGVNHHRKPLREAAYDLGRAIGRRVVADDDLEREVGGLRQGAFDRLGDEALMIVGDHRDTDLGARTLGERLRCHAFSAGVERSLRRRSGPVAFELLVHALAHSG